MKIPTDKEIIELSEDVPALYAALTLHRYGDCNYTEALKLAVAVLAHELTLARETLEKHVRKMPVVYEINGVRYVPDAKRPS